MEGHCVLPVVFEAFKLGYRRQWTPRGTGHNTPAGHQGLTQGWKISMAGWQAGLRLRCSTGGSAPFQGPPLGRPPALEDSSRELEELRYGSD